MPASHNHETLKTEEQQLQSERRKVNDTILRDGFRTAAWCVWNITETGFTVAGPQYVI